MESMRDVNRVMEREIAKGGCPLKLSHIEFDADSYQEIVSEEKLQEVLAYLLRVGEYSQYAGKTVINNVYMDLKGRKPVFVRTKTGMERKHIFSAIKRYAKKLCPEYNGNVYLETARCYFTLPEEYMEKYRYVYEGRETYAFLMSDKYIMGLYTHCLVARKEAFTEDMEEVSEKIQGMMKLSSVQNVLFQCLLLDDVQAEDGGITANMYSIYQITQELII